MRDKINANKHVLVAMLLIIALAATLTGTLAAPGDDNVTLTCESGISSDYTIEVGQVKDRTVLNLNEARSGDTALAGVTYTTTGLSNLHITGVKAGVVTVAYGTRLGLVTTDRYQITDSNNISAYTIKKGGVVELSGSGKTETVPVQINAGDNNIKWRSSNKAVATVDASSGLITAVSKGMAIIIGDFTDKWGVDRDIHVLVGVGMTAGGGDLSELIDLVNQGQDILNNHSDEYTEDSLNDLQEAVDQGNSVLEMEDPSAQEIKDAIDDLKDALNNLKEKGDGGSSGKYRPLDKPKHVYEVLDKDGNSQEPPVYIYNEGDNPGDGNDKNVTKDEGDNFYVEEPKNIFTPINEDGTLDEEHAFWGGPDGKPGGGDDLSVENKDGDYWVHVGQNVWFKYNPSKPYVQGTLVGGGPDGDPTTDPVTPIYDNTDIDGKYYVGPLGPDDDGNMYYYGDPASGGNGTLDSTATSLEKDDVKYYKNDDGTMTTTKPKQITEIPTVTGGDGRTLDDSLTGDGAWIEIARNGNYSLIIRKDFIDTYSTVTHLGDPKYNGVLYSDGATAGIQYKDSKLYDVVNGWFNPGASFDSNKLASGARLRDFTVRNNAKEATGTIGNTSNGFSKPETMLDRTGMDVAFVLSFSEAANFCSKTYYPGSQSSDSAAVANFNKLTVYKDLEALPAANKLGAFWLRTLGSTNESGATPRGTTCSVASNGYVFQAETTGWGIQGFADTCFVYPSLWVHQDIFNSGMKAPGTPK